MRYKLEAPFKSPHGRLSKSTTIIWANNTTTGTNYTQIRENPYSGPLTAAQKAVNSRFKTITSQVNSLRVEDPDKYQELKRKFQQQKKYKTLRGYIFSKLWFEDVENENS